MYRHTLDPVMEAVATMADYRFVHGFRCKATMRLPGDERDREFTVRADPTRSSYSVYEIETDRIWSYEPGSMTKISGGISEPKLANQVHDDPLPVRLAFPLSLPIWGRKRDVYRMVDGKRSDSYLAISLDSYEPGTFSGLLTIDRRLRMIVRLDVPTLFLEYSDIEPHHPKEFHKG